MHRLLFVTVVTSLCLPALSLHANEKQVIKAIESVSNVSKWLQRIDEREVEATADLETRVKTYDRCLHTLRFRQGTPSGPSQIASELNFWRRQQRIERQQSYRSTVRKAEVQQAIKDFTICQKLVAIDDEKIYLEAVEHFEGLHNEASAELRELREQFAEERNVLLAEVERDRKIFHELVKKHFVDEPSGVVLKQAKTEEHYPPPGMKATWVDGNGDPVVTATIMYSGLTDETRNILGKVGGYRGETLGDYMISHSSDSRLQIGVGRFDVRLQSASATKELPKPLVELADKLVDLEKLATVPGPPITRDAMKFIQHAARDR